MTALSTEAFMALVSARTGHFVLESGLHSARWLDLDALFASPHRVEPFIAALAGRLAPFRVDAICGPLVGGAFLAQRLAQLVGVEFWFTAPVASADGPGLYRARYQLPPGFRGRRATPRLALVDDVMSAGSSLRATHAALKPDGEVVVVGSLLQLGTVGAARFAEAGIPVASVFAEPFETWPPAECPHCAAGHPLDVVHT